jgi:hypothetical protein
MSFKTFFESQEENSKDGYFLKEKDLSEIEYEVPILRKMSETYNGTLTSNTVIGFRETQEPGRKTPSPLFSNREGFLGLTNPEKKSDFYLYLLPSYYTNSNPNRDPKERNGLTSTVQKLERFGEVEFFPDFFTGQGLRIRFNIDEKMKPGDFKMRSIDQFDNSKNPINFDCNYDSLDQVKSIVEGAIDIILDEAKKVRVIILPKVFAKQKEFSKELKKEYKKTYSELIDRFKEDGFISPSDIDEDILGLTVLKVAKDNPEFLDLLNDLSDDEKRGFFRYASEIFGEKPIIFKKDSINLIQQIYDLKSVWNLI